MASASRSTMRAPGSRAFDTPLLLHPDIVKVDTSLTRNIDGDRAKRAMTSALVSFGEEMGIAIVAEGIETREELETLVTLGVPFGQGFYLAEPAPL